MKTLRTLTLALTALLTATLGVGAVRAERGDSTPLLKVGGQAGLGRQLGKRTAWLTERHGYDPT